jgi:hypothetical protein
MQLTPDAYYLTTRFLLNDLYFFSWRKTPIFTSIQNYMQSYKFHACFHSSSSSSSSYIWTADTTAKYSGSRTIFSENQLILISPINKFWFACRIGGARRCSFVLCYTLGVDGQPVLSSGQSSWLQIQRSGFDSRCYQIFWEVVGLERSPLSLVSTTEELLGRESSW